MRADKQSHQRQWNFSFSTKQQCTTALQKNGIMLQMLS